MQGCLADTYSNWKRLYFVFHSVILIHSMFFLSSTAKAREVAIDKFSAQNGCHENEVITTVYVYSDYLDIFQSRGNFIHSDEISTLLGRRFS